MEVEGGGGRRVTRQATRKTAEPVTSPKKEDLPEPNLKRKRSKIRKECSSPSARPARKSRSIHSNRNEPESTEGKVESGNSDLKPQSSWSSSISISDDEELPAAVLHSPIKSSGKKTYKKNDIVWIKHRTDEYRPCLITSVERDHVKFKFVNETRKYTWRAKFNKIIPFDDPEKNIELLNLGRKKCPRIVDAFDRVKHYFCQLSEDKTLVPMKYLLPAGTEDLLYGIVAAERTEEDIDSEEEFNNPILDSEECDSHANADKEDGVKDSSDVELSKDEDEIQNSKEDEKSIHENISDEVKAEIYPKIKALLEIIQSENCFNYLKQLVEGPEENSRMKLFRENEEAKLMFRSGWGPFFVAEKELTDQLSETVEAYAKKLDFRGDVSLLERHVLTPEAIMFALQTLCKWERDPAERFFLKWALQIPEWTET